MFISVQMTMYKCSFTEQEFTNVDLLGSNYKVAMFEC